MRIHISQLQVSHGSGWRQNCHLEVSLSFLDSGGSLSGDGGGLSSSDGGDSNGEETSEGGSDHGGVVDHVLGDVVGHVLLDSDLGHVLDGVVNVVAYVLENGASGIGDRCGVVSGNSGGSNNLVDGRVCSNSRSGDNLRGGSKPGDGVGSNSGGGNPWLAVGSNSGGGDNRSVMDERDNSADGVNKAVLVEVLGESLEGE